MSTVMLTGLLQIDLEGHTVRLCDGGTVEWDGNTWESDDTLFGSIAGIEVPEEGTGDEAPMVTIGFLPPAGVASSDLIDPSYQGARARFWIAERDVEDGTIVGTPEQQADLMIDVPRLRIEKAARVLEVDMVPFLERVFLSEEGNTLSDVFHQSIYPGELGLANATGVGYTFAFGTISAARGVAGGGGSGGAPGGEQQSYV